MASVREEDVGITEFLCTRAPFEAIHKQLIDDFIVNEIAEDGTVVTQVSTEVPKAKDKDRNATATQRREAPKSEEGSKDDSKKVEGGAPMPSEQGDAVPNAMEETGFAGSFNAKTTEDAVAGQQGAACAPSSGDVEAKKPLFADVDFAALDALFPGAAAPHSGLLPAALEKGEAYTFPPQADKTARTQLHTWVREQLNGWLSETVKDEATNASCIRVRKGRNVKRGRGADGEMRDGKRRRRDADPSYVGRNDVVQCTLWKRGRDTMEAVAEVCKALGVAENAASVAGTKDRRGITVQHLRVKGAHMWRFAKAARWKGFFFRNYRCISLGDFVVLRDRDAKPLRLGHLKGNRFTLVLRGVGGAELALIERAVDELRAYGFVNYFGLQRFGSGVRPTHTTGFALLRGAYREAVLGILTPLEVQVEAGDSAVSGRRRAAEVALRRFVDGELKAKELREALPNMMRIERSLARSMERDESQGRPRNYEVAFSSLHRNMKSMYIHATQSYLWNSMASARFAACSNDSTAMRFAVAGDLVPIDVKTAHLNCDTKVRSVTEEEEKACAIAIQDVVLPVIGSKVPPPSKDTETGRVAHEIANHEKIDFNEVFSGMAQEFRGSYRRIVCIPEDVSHSIQAYDRGSKRPLAQCRYGTRNPRRDNPKAENDGKTEKKVVDVEMRDEEVARAGDSTTLNGSSKVQKLASADDVKEFPQPEENPVMAVDNEAKEEIVDVDPKVDASETKDENGDDSKEGGYDVKGGASGGAHEQNKNHGVEQDRALIISFSLGTSSYATMLVRELTHTSTEVGHQKKLTKRATDPGGAKDNAAKGDESTVKNVEEGGQTRVNASETPKCDVDDDQTGKAGAMVDEELPVTENGGDECSKSNVATKVQGEVDAESFEVTLNGEGKAEDEQATGTGGDATKSLQ